MISWLVVKCVGWSCLLARSLVWHKWALRETFAAWEVSCANTYSGRGLAVLGIV